MNALCEDLRTMVGFEATIYTAHVLMMVFELLESPEEFDGGATSEEWSEGIDQIAESLYRGGWLSLAEEEKWYISPIMRAMLEASKEFYDRTDLVLHGKRLTVEE